MRREQLQRVAAPAGREQCIGFNCDGLGACNARSRGGVVGEWQTHLELRAVAATHETGQRPGAIDGVLEHAGVGIPQRRDERRESESPIFEACHAQVHELRGLFPDIPGERQIIVLDIESIMTTCGFAVPLYEFAGHRTQLPEFTCKMGDEKMDQYRREKNQTSIEGLPTHLFEDPAR